MGLNELVVLPYGLLDRPSLRYVDSLIMLTRSLGKPSHPTSLHRGIHHATVGDGHQMDCSFTESATLDEVECATILNRLRHYEWNQQATARSLGIHIQKLQRRIADMRSRGITCPSA